MLLSKPPKLLYQRPHSLKKQFPRNLSSTLLFSWLSTNIMMNPMPPNEIISGIFGSISLTAWITVLVRRTYFTTGFNNANPSAGAPASCQLQVRECRGPQYGLLVYMATRRYSKLCWYVVYSAMDCSCTLTRSRCPSHTSCAHCHWVSRLLLYCRPDSHRSMLLLQDDQTSPAIHFVYGSRCDLV